MSNSNPERAYFGNIYNTYTVNIGGKEKIPITTICLKVISLNKINFYVEYYIKKSEFSSFLISNYFFI